jgi:hypothetical protein
LTPPDHSGAAKIQICTSVALTRMNPMSAPNGGSAPAAYGLLAVALQLSMADARDATAWLPLPSVLFPARRGQ